MVRIVSCVVRCITTACLAGVLAMPVTIVGAQEMCPGVGGQALNTDPLWGYPHVGGVLLDKSLTLLNAMDDIKGVRYDPDRAELVFIGQGTVPVAERIEIDDLVVAVKSVYEMNEFPGITFYSDVPTSTIYERGTWGVTYIGATKDTAFGQILYEADFLLKKLGLGIDEQGFPLTGEYSALRQPLQALGYVSLTERLQQKDALGSELSVELSFRPKHVMVAVQQEGTVARDFVFRDIAMQVTWRILDANNREVQNPPTAFENATREFAEHLTARYDDYAKLPSFEVLNKLKRLGKITAVVNWLYDAQIPVDLSFVATHKPTQRVTTPTSATVLRGCIGSTGKVTESGSGPYRRVSPTVPAGCRGLVGGILYDKENSYCNGPDPDTRCLTPAETNMLVQATSAPNRVLNPDNRDDLKWSFQANSQAYDAIAQTVLPIGKDGRIAFTTADLVFPNQAGQALALVRYYDSFSGIDSGFGPGWSAVPFSVTIPTPATLTPVDAMNTPYANDFFYPYLTLFDRVAGKAVQFKPWYLVSDKRKDGIPPGFMSFEVDGVAHIVPSYITGTGSNDVILDFEYVRKKIAVDLPGRFLYIQLAPNTDDIYASKYVWLKQPSRHGKLLWHADAATVSVPGQSGAGSVVLYFAYHPDTGRMSSMRTADGKTIILEPQGDHIGRSVFTGADGKRRSVTYEYNPAGQLWRVTAANGAQTEYGYADASDDAKPGAVASIVDQSRRQTRMTWDPDLEHRAKQATPGADTTRRRAFDFARATGTIRMAEPGNVTSILVRDKLGRVKSMSSTAPAGSANLTLTENWRYEHTSNALAGPSHHTDIRNITTAMGYDAAGNINSIQRGNKTIQVRRGVDSVDGSPLTVLTDAKGRRSAIKVDYAGRPQTIYRRVWVSSEVPCSGSDSDVVITCFTFTPEPGSRRDVFYDASGAPTRVTLDAAGLSARYPWIPRTATTQVTARSEFGQPAVLRSAAGYVSEFHYDDLGRINWLQHPGDVTRTNIDYVESGLAQDLPAKAVAATGTRSWSYEPLSRQVTETDERGVSTTRFYDQYGLLTRVVEATAQAQTQTILTTQYFYDADNRLTQKVLPNGTVVVYVYDGFGRISEQKELDSADAPSNTKPIITTAPQPSYSVSVGGALSVPLAATDFNGDRLVFSLVDPPRGMSINEQTGLITWRPETASAGTTPVVVQVLDGRGGIVTTTFTVDVWPAGAPDSDGDGVPDAYDILPKDRRYARDRDDDGMADEWEVAVHLDTDRNDAYEDRDSDGATNIDEFTAGTDPYNADSDGDGMEDGGELIAGRNPLVNEDTVVTVIQLLIE